MQEEGRLFVNLTLNLELVYVDACHRHFCEGIVCMAEGDDGADLEI